jgi:hypothetical protein
MSFPFSGKEKDLVLRNFIVMKANTQGTIKKQVLMQKCNLMTSKDIFTLKLVFLIQKVCWRR